MAEWHCIGTPPATPPCGAHGTTDTAAEAHVRETQHGTGPVEAARWAEVEE